MVVALPNVELSRSRPNECSDRAREQQISTSCRKQKGGRLSASVKSYVVPLPRSYLTYRL